MKLSDLKPCAACKGPLPPIWYVVRFSMAMLDRNATNAVLGLATMFNGALGLAEAMAPNADGAVVVMGDKEKDLLTEFNICSDCFLMKSISLAVISEQINREKNG